MLALGLAVACANEAEREPKPRAPDISSTLHAYQNPSLELTDDTAAPLLEYVDETMRLLEDLDLERQLLDPIYEALDLEAPPAGGAGGSTSQAPRETRLVQAGRAREKSQAATLEGDGFLRVTRVCAGWEEPVVDEEKNGSLQAIVGFTDDGLDPVIWGDATRCKYQTGAGDVLIQTGDGALEAGMALHIGEGLTEETFGSEPILYVVNLDAQIGESLQELRFSFRYDQGAQLFELLFETSEGSLVLIVQDGSIAGVRARNGEYFCDADRRVCTAPDGSVIPL